MEDIIVINDDSQEAAHAAEFALHLAQKLNKNLLVANLTKTAEQTADVRVAITSTGIDIFEDDHAENNLSEHLNLLNSLYAGFHPAIKMVDAYGLSENEVVAFINRNQVHMIVQGASSLPIKTSGLNIQSVLNRVRCPLMIVPVNYTFEAFERIAYLTDLRYCQAQIINYLAKLNQPNKPAITIAHLCNEGLPELDQAYANDLFARGISTQVNASGLYFNLIREKNMPTTIDVMSNGLESDLLVCTNRQFHFEELLGQQISAALPGHVDIPVLVFPC